MKTTMRRSLPEYLPDGRIRFTRALAVPERSPSARSLLEYLPDGRTRFTRALAVPERPQAPELPEFRCRPLHSPACFTRRRCDPASGPAIWRVSTGSDCGIQCWNRKSRGSGIMHGFSHLCGFGQKRGSRPQARTGGPPPKALPHDKAGETPAFPGYMDSRLRGNDQGGPGVSPADARVRRDAPSPRTSVAPIRPDPRAPADSVA